MLHTYKRWTRLFILLLESSVGLVYGIEKLDNFIPDGLKEIVDEPLLETDFLPYIESIKNSDYLKTIWGNQIMFGWMAFRRNNWFQCEQQWQKALDIFLPEDMNKSLLKRLCKVYKFLHSPIRFLLYEKYVEAFPKEQDVPRVHLALGYHYLNCQAYDRALSHYYKVLNATFNIESSHFEAYENYVIWAQIGIAQVYLMQKKYEKAFDFFSKIHFKNTDAAIGADVLYKKALCAYYSGHLEEAVKCLESYCELSLDTAEMPEAYYHLIHAYKRLEQKDKVLKTIFALLQIGQEKRIEQAKYWQNWDKYQKLSASEVAQDFYKEGNLVEAIKLYQVLVDMNKTPDWQWPILCQMGLCYERLGLSIKSKAAYELMANATETWNDVPIVWTEDLRNYQLQAKWHLEQIKIYENIKLNFEQLVRTL